jgi:hypothetical protein
MEKDGEWNLRPRNRLSKSSGGEKAKVLRLSSPKGFRLLRPRKTLAGNGNDSMASVSPHIFPHSPLPVFKASGSLRVASCGATSSPKSSLLPSGKLPPWTEVTSMADAAHPDFPHSRSERSANASRLPAFPADAFARLPEWLRLLGRASARRRLSPRAKHTSAAGASPPVFPDSPLPK